MSENSTPEQRTEMPTDRRMQQLRKEGAIFHSIDLVQVISLISAFLILSISGRPLLDNLKIVFEKSFKLIEKANTLDFQTMNNGFLGLVILIGPNVITIAATIAFVSSLAVLIQTNFNIRENKINFKLSMLNPITGLSRIFSMAGLVNTLKALLKLTIILPLSYFAIKAFAPDMISLLHMSVYQILAFSGEKIMLLFWKISYILMGFAAFDFVWGKYNWLKNNKMTKEEVKDERKSVEGDEETKRRIQAKGLQRIAQRIKESVKKADVVVTNPTHYAVALKYDRDAMDAPTVVAKGQGFMAQRIKEIAREAGVPVLERKPLARALYASVEVGSVIPRELFKAVAEVLAYVYRLKNPWKYATAEKKN